MLHLHFTVIDTTTSIDNTVDVILDATNGGVILTRYFNFEMPFEHGLAFIKYSWRNLSRNIATRGKTAKDEIGC